MTYDPGPDRAKEAKRDRRDHHRKIRGKKAKDTGPRKEATLEAFGGDL